MSSLNAKALLSVLLLGVVMAVIYSPPQAQWTTGRRGVLADLDYSLAPNHDLSHQK